jgi:hypothetical protein
MEMDECIVSLYECDLECMYRKKDKINNKCGNRHQTSNLFYSVPKWGNLLFFIKRLGLNFAISMRKGVLL